MAAKQKTGALFLVNMVKDMKSPGAKLPVWDDVFVLTMTIDEAREVPQEERFVDRGFVLAGIHKLTPVQQGVARLPQSGTYEHASWMFTLDKSRRGVV